MSRMSFESWEPTYEGQHKHYELFVTAIQDFFSIRWGRAGPETNGIVVKTAVVGEDMSVGLTKDDQPVFVRIDYAADYDDRLKPMIRRAKQNKLTPADHGIIVSFAVEKMNYVLKRYLSMKKKQAAAEKRAKKARRS